MLRHLIRVCFVFVFVTPAWGEIEPTEIAILANKTSRESLAVASYYAKARKIPVENICQIEFPKGEALDRATWDRQIRPAIRAWVTRRQMTDRIRLFVTVWDVPLKIGKQDPPSQSLQIRQLFLQRELERHRDAMGDLIARMRQLAPAAEEENAGDSPTSQPTKKGTLTDQFNQAFNDARKRVNAMSDSPEKQQATEQLSGAFVQAAGLGGIVQNLSRNQELKTSEKVRSEFDISRGRLQAIQLGRLAVEGTRADARRDAQALALVVQMGGENAALAWLDDQTGAVDKNETHASLDSELSLVSWPDYDLLRWQPNFLHYSFDQSVLRDVYRTLMVARLEAPTLALTKLLIDRAITVEQNGLDGNLYLDGRGIGKLDNSQVQPDSYADYDRSILIANDLLKDKSRLPVVLNTKFELFQAGECPDAAVYCGWYSLAKYVDAFEWVPGSVGYHIASAEATTIRKPGSQVWCKRMLDDGVCVTFGPVHEPYLTPFPKPHEFLPLLLSGKYTIAECYYRTTRCRSWMMTLIGDPLYNPFKNKPAVKTEELPEAFQRLFEGQ